MTKKREPFLIDLMDDTYSDSADAPKKLGKRLRNGPVSQDFIDVDLTGGMDSPGW